MSDTMIILVSERPFRNDQDAQTARSLLTSKRGSSENLTQQEPFEHTRRKYDIAITEKVETADASERIANENISQSLDSDGDIDGCACCFWKSTPKRSSKNFRERKEGRRRKGKVQSIPRMSATH
eukprot:gene2017-17578_t